jgi:hypothetical protein
MAISISSSDDDEWVLEKVQTEESKVTRCCRDDEKPPKKRQKRSPSKSQTDEDDLDRAFPQPNLDPQTAPKSAPRPTTWVAQFLGWKDLVTQRTPLYSQKDQCVYSNSCNR